MDQEKTRKILSNGRSLSSHLSRKIQAQQASLKRRVEMTFKSRLSKMLPRKGFVRRELSTTFRKIKKSRRWSDSHLEFEAKVSMQNQRDNEVDTNWGFSLIFNIKS